MNSTEYRAQLELPSDTDILITRAFHAPRALVFEAMTSPDYVRRWWGAGHGEVTTCDIDLRVGGRWRFVLTQPDGGAVPFSGEYLEIEAPGRLVNTELFEPVDAPPSTVTTTFEETDGVTTMRALCAYDSRETRDLVIASGMESGMNASYDALEALVSGRRS